MSKRGEPYRDSPWKTLASVLTAVAAIFGAAAAILGSFQAKEYVDYLKYTKRDLYASGENWVCSLVAPDGWKVRGFNDRGWTEVVSPAPDRASVPAGDATHMTMWYSGRTGSGSVYFRRSIDLPGRDRVDRVSILSASDDDHRIYVNGDAVVSDRDLSAGPVLFTDITPFTRTGENVFAVDVMNDSGGCWLVVSVQVQRK